MNCWKIQSSVDDKPFASFGDSSAAVSNDLHHMVGQIHSAIDNGKDTTIAFMASSDTIKTELNRLLGPNCDFLLPTLDSIRGSYLPNGISCTSLQS